jgi:predicted Rossmann-fold nucleotide-binding protein
MMGEEYWGGLIAWMKATLLKTGAISRADLKLFHLTDDPLHAAAFIVKCHKDSIRAVGERRKFNLPPEGPPPM